jgi:hypothetical protein
MDLILIQTNHQQQQMMLLQIQQIVEVELIVLLMQLK